jgi:hypothetical protein
MRSRDKRHLRHIWGACISIFSSECGWCADMRQVIWGLHLPPEVLRLLSTGSLQKRSLDLLGVLGPPRSDLPFLLFSPFSLASR